ncbi:hypothetical protein, partial [Mesorhizobium sp. M8A.F.Ca.ET.182.01.1.1]
IASLNRAEHRAARVDQGRLGQLRVRARTATTEGENDELAFEEELAAKLRAGVRVPRVRLDTIGAVFISASRPATDQISGGI